MDVWILWAYSVSALRECITPVLREANFSLPESGSNGRLEFSAVGVYDEFLLIDSIPPCARGIRGCRLCIATHGPLFLLHASSFYILNWTIMVTVSEDLGGGMKKGTFTVLTVEENPQEVVCEIPSTATLLGKAFVCSTTL